MTKLELMEMLKNVDDNATLTFVGKRSDRDGFPYDVEERVYKVLGGDIITVLGNYGITTLENKTDEYVYTGRLDYYKKREG